MKKLMKISFKITLVLVILALSSWTIFRAKEHLAGNAYLSYLQQHHSSVPLDQLPDFQLMEKDIQDHSLILVGESHGFHAPIKFDVDFFRYLNQEHGVKNYLVEVDYSQAYFLNKYNRNGNDSILIQVLENWVVNPGKNNLDYFNRWKKLGDYYRSGAHFQYHGTDRIADIGLLAAHLEELDPGSPVPYRAQASDSVNLENIKQTVQERLANLSPGDEYHYDYTHIIRNINFKLRGAYREETMTSNLLDLYQQHELKNRKVYGFYGLGHTLQAPIQAPMKGGFRPMASRLVETDNWFKEHILTANFLFADCHRVTKNKNLPFFLQSEGKYKRMPVSYDDIWIGYLHGINDLLRITEPNTLTLFKMDAPDSPYSKSNRLVTTTKLLPFGQIINAQEGYVTTDYGQYMILVRNSNWAEPMDL